MIDRMFLAFLCAGCGALAPVVPPAPHHYVRIYEAYVFQSEYGAEIDNVDCPWAGIGIKIDPSPDGSEFMKVLRYAGGRLGPATKHVIIDGLLRTDKPLSSHSVPTLVRVFRMREKVIDAASMFGPEENRRCIKDEAKQRQWLQRLQQKPRRRG
jgi:hypothetical protein